MKHLKLFVSATLLALASGQALAHQQERSLQDILAQSPCSGVNVGWVGPKAYAVVCAADGSVFKVIELDLPADAKRMTHVGITTADTATNVTPNPPPSGTGSVSTSLVYDTGATYTIVTITYYYVNGELTKVSSTTEVFPKPKNIEK